MELQDLLVPLAQQEKMEQQVLLELLEPQAQPE
jgi:hypothetical protein